MTNQLHWYLITGASTGIGFETALHLHKNEGVGVIALSRNQQRLDHLKSISSDQLITQQYDLLNTDPTILPTLFKKYGINQLKGIIHNAGLLINKPFGEMTKEDLESTYQTNVFAPYLLTQQLLPYLIKSGGAHVVNISSIGGVQGSIKFPGLSAYSSSKGALCTLTECMALELTTEKISVNCLALGAVQTEMLAAAFPGYEAPMTANKMAEYVSWFVMNGQNYFNGKILPVAMSNP